MTEKVFAVWPPTMYVRYNKPALTGLRLQFKKGLRLQFNSRQSSTTVDTLVYHSAHSVSNIPSAYVYSLLIDCPLAGRQSTLGLDARRAQHVAKMDE
eukprot:1194567-Prorocentrum_minimum.AAC.2